MLRTMLLAVHVGAGVVGLVAGPPTIAAALRERRHTPAGRAYLAAVTVLTATAVALVALRPTELWPFLLLAAGTQAAVVGARRPQPMARHIRLVGGSYISLVTALLVVSWGSILAWVLPTVVGTLLVERAAASTRRPRPVRRSSRTPTPSPLP